MFVGIIDFAMMSGALIPLFVVLLNTYMYLIIFMIFFTPVSVSKEVLMYYLSVIEVKVITHIEE